MVKHGFLHCHSMYSTNDSTASPMELVAKAKELGASNITLTDHGTMLGIEPFLKAGQELGINTIPGMEIYLENREHFLLVAMDHTGYQSLIHLFRKAQYKDVGKSTYALVPYQALQEMEHKDHVIATSACVQGPLSKIILSNNKIRSTLIKKKQQMATIEKDAMSYEKTIEEIQAVQDSIKYYQQEIKMEKKFLAPAYKKSLKKKKQSAEQLSLFQNDNQQEIHSMEQNISRAKTQLPILEEKVNQLKKRVAALKKRSSACSGSWKKYKKLLAEEKELEACFIPEEMLYQNAKRKALEYKNLFPHFYIELQYHGLSMEAQAYPALAKIAKETGIPVIAANDAHMTDNSAESIEARRLMRFNYFEKHQEISPADREMYLKDDEELSQALLQILDEGTVAEAMDNLKVLDLCHVSLPDEKHYPKVPTEDSFDSLLQDAKNKMIQQGEWNAVYEARLQHEVAVIKSMGFVDYHLVVRDFCIMGRKLGVVPKEERKNIPSDFSRVDDWLAEHHYTIGEGIGPGRGSAAGSLVCYLLGITNIDPIRYHLLFERFLNPERVTMPDIDTDIATSLRPVLIQYVQWRYGINAVASIMTETTYGAKGAIQAAGRDEADRLYGHLPLKNRNEEKSRFMHKYVYPISDQLDTGMKVSDIDVSTVNDISRDIIHKASLIEGKLFSTGVHAGGVVISDNRDINEYIPIYYNHSLDVWAVQCDMVRLEEKGFLKFDLLGLKNLDIITDTLYLILKHTGSAVDINTIPFEDVVFSGIYSTGRTNSVFQFESAGMKKMLQRFQPSCFEDIILLVAAYRPGPMQYLDDIIAVKQGTKPIHYDIPELEPILSETYGAVIYQEQVMRIFQDLAGYSLGGADLVRRAMSKKKMDKLKKERKAFLYGDKERGICGCLSKGIPEAKADALFDSLMDFAKYAFNKSHAAAYALVSYQTAWLKHHYPDCFACAMLNNTEQKDYAPIIEDCRARGVRILPPSILQSHYDCTIENGAIRLGMRSIKGVAEKTAGFIDQIKSARGSGQLHSFSDFLSCCISEEDGKVIQPPAALVEKMISVGVFDIFYKNRQGLLQAYQEIRKRISSTKGENRMEKVNLIIQFFSVPAWDIPDKKWNMQAELEYLGDVYSESPVSGFAPPQYYGCIPFSQMHPGKNKIMGYICNIEEKVSRKGTPIYILSLFDGKEYLSIIGLQKYFPQLSDYLFLPVSMQVKKGEKGFFLENVRILQKTNQKNETSFICDTMEKQQYLQDILSEDHFAAPAEKYCTLHILRFPHGTDDVVRNVPVVVTVNLTEKAYGQVTQKKWYSK